MNEVVFILEEQSCKEMIQGVIPRLPFAIPAVRYIVFEGKQDLEKNLDKRLRGYRNRNAKFIVIRDQDSSPDCAVLKARLAEICSQAGRPDAIIRIFCKELEAIYLADLSAVEAGLGIKGLSVRQNENKFRSPERIGSPSHELRVLTKGNYQKIGGSRSIGQFLTLDNERSPSFRALIRAIERACQVAQ